MASHSLGKFLKTNNREEVQKKNRTNSDLPMCPSLQISTPYTHIPSVQKGVKIVKGQGIIHTSLKVSKSQSKRAYFSIETLVHQLGVPYFSIYPLSLYTLGSFGIHRTLCKPLFGINELRVGYFPRSTLSPSNGSLRTGALFYSSLNPQEPFIHQIFMEYLQYSRPYARY